MPEPNPAAETELYNDACKGDPHARSFLGALFRASQIIDDIADGDVSPDALAEVMALLFRDAFANPFYIAHAQELASVVAGAAFNWAQSTTWEKSDRHRQAYAFVWRESLDMIVQTVAHICGGPAHALAIRTRSAELFYTGDQRESFTRWAREARG